MKVWSCYRLLNLSLCTYLHVKIVVVNLRVLVVALTKFDSNFKYCDCEYHCVYIAWVYCTGITLLKLSIIIGFLSAERTHAVAVGPFYHNILFSMFNMQANLTHVTTDQLSNIPRS